MRDLYDVLGVRRDAQTEEIRSAYRQRARMCHPDLNGGFPEAEEAFKEVGFAYAVLSDPQARALYDVYGDEGLDDGVIRTALTRPEVVRAASELLGESLRASASGTGRARSGPSLPPEWRRQEERRADGPEAAEPAAPATPPAARRPGRLVRLARAAAAARRRARAALGRRLDAWASEPPGSVAARLERLADATEAVGGEWLRSVERIEDAFADYARQIDRTGERIVAGRPAPATEEGVEPRVLSALQGTLLALGALVAAVLFGSLNAWALAGRLEHLAAAQPALPWAEAVGRWAWSIGVAVSVAAVGVGLIRRALGQFGRSDAPGLLVDMAPALLLVCLFGLQAVAFFGVGAELDAATVADGAWLPVPGELVSLLATLLGGSAVLLLAALGYAMWVGSRSVLAAVAAMLTAGHLAAARWRHRELEERARQAGERLRALAARTTAVAEDLGRDFADRAGLGGVETVGQGLRELAQGLLDGAEEGSTGLGGRKGDPSGARRTRGALVVAADVALLVAGGLSAVFVARSVAAGVPAVAPHLDGAWLAAALLGTLLVGSFLARELGGPAAYANPLRDLLPTTSARRMVAAGGAVAAGASVLVVAWLQVAGASAGPPALLVALATLVPAGGVVLVSVRLDRCLLALGRAVAVVPLLLLWFALETTAPFSRLFAGRPATPSSGPRRRRVATS